MPHTISTRRAVQVNPTGGVSSAVLEGASSFAIGASGDLTPGVAPPPSSGSGPRSIVLPQNLLTAGPTLVEGFETFADWTLVRGAIADDGTHVSQGTHALQLSTDGVTNSPAADTTVSLDYSADGGIGPSRIDIWVDASAAGRSLTIFLSANAGLTKYWQGSSGTFVRAGWNRIQLPQSTWAATGGMTWNDPIVKIRVQYQGSADNQTVTLDNFTRVTPVAAVALIFDDGYESVYDAAFPILQERGIPATIGVNSESVGDAGYCTEAELLEMRAAGWSLVNHTSDHTNLTTLGTQAEMEGKIDPCTAYLAGIGVPTGENDIFIYPQGAYNDTVQAAVVAADQLWARTVEENQNEPMPWIDNQTVAAKQLGSATSAVTATGYLDTAIARGDLVQLFTHRVVTSGHSSGDWWPDRLETLADHIVANEITPLTYAQIEDLRSGPLDVAWGVSSGASRRRSRFGFPLLGRLFR